MPSVCRRIVVLLVVALIGVGGPVASAFAQSSGGGAGDQQYEDPFGGSGSSGSSGSGSSGGSNNSSSNSDSGAQPLTQAPQTSGSGTRGSSSSGTSTPSTSGTSTAAPTPQAQGQLPNTGLDARILVLAGVVLVVAGLGLRLRNAPERF